eukprot:scaffold1402_cov155-Amphora_coffeaeformis.AAC.5
MHWRLYRARRKPIAAGLRWNLCQAVLACQPRTKDGREYFVQARSSPCNSVHGSSALYRLDRLWYTYHSREARIKALPCARRFINTNIGTLVGPSGQEPLERWAMSLETG